MLTLSEADNLLMIPGPTPVQHQKPLGVPPGLTILALSPEAMERRRMLARVPSYYADSLNWEASMADPTVYFSTHAVNLFYALRAAVEIIVREGLGARFARHERFRSELSNRGVVAAGCLRQFRGRGVRFGHMGNIAEAEILRAVGAIESTLLELGVSVELGAGLKVAQDAMVSCAVVS